LAVASTTEEAQRMIRAVKLLLLFLQVVVEEVLRPAFSFLWTTSWGKRRSQLSILLLVVRC
jgi:hypothetical protein